MRIRQESERNTGRHWPGMVRSAAATAMCAVAFAATPAQEAIAGPVKPDRNPVTAASENAFLTTISARAVNRRRHVLSPSQSWFNALPDNAPLPPEPTTPPAKPLRPHHVSRGGIPIYMNIPGLEDNPLLGIQRVREMGIQGTRFAVDMGRTNRIRESDPDNHKLTTICKGPNNACPPNVYDFTRYIREARLSRRVLGTKPEILIDISTIPAWAGGGDKGQFTSKVNERAVLRFVSAAAAQFRNDAASLSFINEPRENGIPERTFARLWNEGASIIRRIAPKVPLYFGEFSRWSQNYLNDMVTKYHAKFVANAITIHGYDSYTKQSKPPKGKYFWDVFHLKNVKKYLNKIKNSVHTPDGNPLPIAVTEYGEPRLDAKIDFFGRLTDLQIAKRICSAQKQMVKYAKSVAYYALSKPDEYWLKLHGWDTSFIDHDMTHGFRQFFAVRNGIARGKCNK